MAGLTQAKAKKVLREETPTLRGKKITKAQRGLLGLLAGGGKPTRLSKKQRQLKALKK